jgi:hypothetical protein
MEYTPRQGYLLLVTCQHIGCYSSLESTIFLYCKRVVLYAALIKGKEIFFVLIGIPSKDLDFFSRIFAELLFDFDAHCTDPQRAEAPNCIHYRELDQ